MSKWINVAGGVAFASMLALASFNAGSCSRDKEVEELSVRLAKSAETIEIGKGLYSTAIVELKSAEILLDGSRTEIVLLEEQLKKTDAKLLTAQQLTVKWKKAYEAALNVDQVDEPDVDNPGVIRKRINFFGDLGPIHASGHTITDPPEAFLKLEQLTPLILTVAVAQNKDGSWTSYATSSDENVDVKVNLAGVSPRILEEKWFKRFWLDIGGSFIDDQSTTVAISYRGKRYSVGAFCFVADGSNGCGATLGIRIFK